MSEIWICLSLKELNILQEDLNLSKVNRTKIWAKIQRRKESEEKIKAGA